MGTLRNGKSRNNFGTDYIPDIPYKEKVEQDIFNILEIENPTEKLLNICCTECEVNYSGMEIKELVLFVQIKLWLKMDVAL